MKALFLKTAETRAAIANGEEAPIICIVQHEIGYRPVNVTQGTDELLNILNENTTIPPDVARSAVNGSMFGWDSPSADAANRWFAKRLPWDESMLPKDPALAAVLHKIMRR